MGAAQAEGLGLERLGILQGALRYLPSQPSLQRPSSVEPVKLNLGCGGGSHKAQHRGWQI